MSMLEQYFLPGFQFPSRRLDCPCQWYWLAGWLPTSGKFITESPARDHPISIKWINSILEFLYPRSQVSGRSYRKLAKKRVCLKFNDYKFTIYAPPLLYRKPDFLYFVVEVCWLFLCGLVTGLFMLICPENKILDYFSISFRVRPRPSSLLWLDYFPHISLICYPDAPTDKNRRGHHKKSREKNIFGKMLIFVNKQVFRECPVSSAGNIFSSKAMILLWGEHEICWCCLR